MILTSAGLLTFVLATFAVLATPGVTVSAITGTTLSHGPRAGFAMEIGAGIARISMVAILAVGLRAVSEAMLFLFDWVKLAGAAYLVWIGIKTITHPPGFNPEAGTVPGALDQSQSLDFLWGFRAAIHRSRCGNPAANPRRRSHMGWHRRPDRQLLYPAVRWRPSSFPWAFRKKAWNCIGFDPDRGRGLACAPAQGMTKAPDEQAHRLLSGLF